MESWINYLFALGAAFCWAISAPVLNIGFRRISKAESRGKLWTIGLCTVIAMTMGSLLLGATLIALQQPLRVLGSPAVIAAGLFTFPIATGFYYLASLSLSAQTQVASLFAKVKPLFSIALAVFVLKQGLVLTEYLAVGFIVLGLFAFSRGLKLGLGAFNGLTLGLASAAAWALGELFVDIGFDGSANLSNSFQALVSATILSAGLILVLKPKVIPEKIQYRQWFGYLRACLRRRQPFKYFKTVKTIKSGTTDPIRCRNLPEYISFSSQDSVKSFAGGNQCRRPIL